MDQDFVDQIETDHLYDIIIDLLEPRVKLLSVPQKRRFLNICLTRIRNKLLTLELNELRRLETPASTPLPVEKKRKLVRTDTNTII